MPVAARIAFPTRADTINTQTVGAIIRITAALGATALILGSRGRRCHRSPDLGLDAYPSPTALKTMAPSPDGAGEERMGGIGEMGGTARWRELRHLPTSNVAHDYCIFMKKTLDRQGTGW